MYKIPEGVPTHFASLRCASRRFAMIALRRFAISVWTSGMIMWNVVARPSRFAFLAYRFAKRRLALTLFVFWIWANHED